MFVMLALPAVLLLLKLISPLKLAVRLFAMVALPAVLVSPKLRKPTLLMLALPGSPYVYAGDELGLPQAVVPDEAKLDPIFWRSGGVRAGRDGCRVPMPWNADMIGANSTPKPGPPQKKKAKAARKGVDARKSKRR